jgi:mRNA-degrading endonuclease toxin of MazEF toxin-antitoxin module
MVEAERRRRWLGLATARRLLVGGNGMKSMETERHKGDQGAAGDSTGHGVSLLRTVNHDMLGRKLGALPDAELAEVEVAMSIILGL